MRVAWGVVFSVAAVSRAASEDVPKGDAPTGGSSTVQLGEDLLEDAGMPMPMSMPDSSSPIGGDGGSSDVVVEPEYKYQMAKEPVVEVSKTLLLETFQKTDSLAASGWMSLDATSEQRSKFKGAWEVVDDEPKWTKGEKVLKMNTPSAYHGLAKLLSKEIDTAASKELSDIYATMEVKFDEAHTCGGAYFKLFHTENVDDNTVNAFTDSTPYSIMFGPDHCGYGTNKVHFIIKFPHPSKPGEYVEEHLKNTPSAKSASVGPLVQTQQFGFAIHKDGTYEIYQNGKKFASGKLKDDFLTKFTTEETIPDPNDIKPADWVDEKMIEDPEAVKPEDWDETEPEMIEDVDAEKPEDWLDDEPQMIPNPEAVKPKDWNDEEDGVWTAPMMPNPDCITGCGEWKRPMIKNPAYKGKWVRPKIDNPDYQGEWKAREIPNPDFYDIENPWTVIQPMNALGFELWTVEKGTTFNNIMLTTDRDVFDSFLEQTYTYKSILEKENVALYEKSRKDAAEKKKTEDKKSSSETSTITQAIELITDVYKRYTEGKPASMIMVAFGIPMMFIVLGISKLIRRGTSSVCATKQKQQTAAGSSPSKKDTSTSSDKEDDDVNKENLTNEKTTSGTKGGDETNAEEEVVNNDDNNNVNSSSTIRKRRGSSGTRRAAAAAATAPQN